MSDRNATDARRERVKPGIYRRINGDGSTIYELTYRDSDGRQRRETVGAKLREAEARLAQVKADMSRGVRIAPKRDLTVKAAAEEWFASTEHLRSTTRKAYRASLDTHVLPEFGRRRLEASPPTTSRTGRSVRAPCPTGSKLTTEPAPPQPFRTGHGPSTSP